MTTFIGLDDSGRHLRVTPAVEAAGSRARKGRRMSVDVGTRDMERLLHLNATPERRATAARILNRHAQGVVRIAQQIAAQELRQDRPEKRRPLENRGKPHYVESFKILPATQASIDRTEIRWGNTHPAAHIIEFGAEPHEIGAGGRGGSGTGPNTGPGKLVFPYKKGAQGAVTPGGPPGQWPVDFANGRRGGGRKAVVDKVNHPGSPAFRILARAIARYRAQARNNPGGSHRSRR